MPSEVLKGYTLPFYSVKGKVSTGTEREDFDGPGGLEQVPS